MSIQLEVYLGSLLTVPHVEAIVIPANKQLTLGWGAHLAQAVLRQGGKEIEQEALGQHPTGIALGEAVSTRAGRLPFQWIVHAAVLDKYNLNPLFLFRLCQRTSDETLWKAVLASLAEAERLKIRTLAFSPMGAGIGGRPMEKAARLMGDALFSHFQKCSRSVIRKIVFAVLKEEDKKIFRDRIQALELLPLKQADLSDQLLNEVYARIAKVEFMMGIAALQEKLNIPVPEAFFDDIIRIEHEHLLSLYQQKGERAMLDRLYNNRFEIRGKDIVKIRRYPTSEEEEHTQAMAFDVLLSAIKAERRRLLGYYFEGGSQRVLEELQQ